jgi:hypothetical protein
MTSREAWVTSELVDLSEATLADTWASENAELLASKQRLLARIDNPKSSFGGYNPQRES